MGFNPKVVASIILGALFVLPSPVHAAKYKINWLIGHPTTDYFEEAADYFKHAIEKGSKGEISVTITPNPNPWEDSGQGTPGPEIAHKVAKGEAQMGHSFTDVMGGMDNRLWAFDLPFLFRDYAHVEQVVTGPIGNELLTGLGDHGIKGLAFTFSGGANILSTRDRQVRGPQDLKGLRVAVFGDEVDGFWLKSLGATPVSIGHREDRVLDLAMKDEIDGAVLTWRRQERAAMGERAAYGNLEGASYLLSVSYINKEFFESLPKEYQRLIEEVSRETGRIERAQTIELNARHKRRLMSKGMSSVALSEAGKRSFEEALKPAYAGKFSELVGKDLIEKIRNTHADRRLAQSPR